MDKKRLKEAFKERFGATHPHLFFAPGRVNLIGEHTDYNGGHVFPCAITLGTYGAAVKREDGQINLYSENFPDLGIISFYLNDLQYRKEDNWANYPKGVIKYMKEAGYNVSSGMDILIEGNIPNGAGLSSSASIELLTGVIVKELFQLDIDQLALIKIGQKVENAFIGVNSGIMDQFAVGMGEKDHALLLDTNSLQYEKIPLELHGNVIVIMNTKKRRELADSKYNERRSECEEALKRLQTVIDIDTLGDLNEETFETHREAIHDDVLERRAKHAVYENQRTIKAAQALKDGDLEAFGQLMNDSHLSTEKDYEVTGIELDTLVHEAWKQPDVVGARMTGAGFGGCAIAIVKKEAVERFVDEVGKVYEKEIGHPAEFYVAQVSDGAKVLKELK
ncbi:galactokinase [Pisciglobus halotolerans]|uniref:Galactokinase n=1 Tax=Pisciglobus halotolerans TaxID=745365 RepID=A0A1I3BMW3_9LACT|nr:galactokinase [Pisciglobus halotolerans]SFH63101.1 galactokinase [Pisciglobus halotolerans]